MRSLAHDVVVRVMQMTSVLEQPDAVPAEQRARIVEALLRLAELGPQLAKAETDLTMSLMRVEELR